MSKITVDTVKKISSLAHIKIDDAHLNHVAQELDSIVNWVEKLNQIDVSNVQPLTGGIDMALSLREDQINDGGYPDKIVKNAPSPDEFFFTVPKVVE